MTPANGTPVERQAMSCAVVLILGHAAPNDDIASWTTAVDGRITEVYTIEGVSIPLTVDEGHAVAGKYKSLMKNAASQDGNHPGHAFPVTHGGAPIEDVVVRRLERHLAAEGIAITVEVSHPASLTSLDGIDREIQAAVSMLVGAATLAGSS